MPSSDQKRQTRETILQSASKLLRSRGVTGASVAEVMKGAGLTVGGFYAHFDSKDDMVAEALHRTGEEMRSLLFAGLDRVARSERYAHILERYLSKKHRDRVEQGCPLPSVVGGAARQESALHEEMATEVGLYASELESHLPPVPQARRVALATLALLYGGLTLARAVGPGALSEEILSSCRSFAGAALDALQKRRVRQ